MRADQPVCAAACPTVSPFRTVATLPRSWQGRSLRFRRALAAVEIFEPDDVVELRRRDLEDGRVLDGRDPVHGARAVAEGLPAHDDLLVQDGLADVAELELRLAGLHEPGLVLLAVELQAERGPGLHEEHLAGVGVGERPDELVTP